MKISKLADKAVTELVNGINISNPEHVPLETFGLERSGQGQQPDEIETLGKHTMIAGGVIMVGSLAVEAVGITPDGVMYVGALMGVGGVAVGGVIYGMGRSGR